MDANINPDVMAADEQPVVSHEVYEELMGMRNQIVELKAQKSDVQDFVIIAQQYQQQLPQAQEQLQNLVTEINERAAALQNRFREVVEPFGITGEFSISETEPHYVIERKPEAPAEAAPEAPAE